jgi:hypothetical protein
VGVRYQFATQTSKQRLLTTLMATISPEAFLTFLSWRR